jgi:hypothetical protein
MQNTRAWTSARFWLLLARPGNALGRLFGALDHLCLRWMRFCERKAAFATARALGRDLDDLSRRLREAGR